MLAAGGVYAYSALSGGPAQLATHTPGDAVAYLEVNLDPPAAQKVAAIRFLLELLPPFKTTPSHPRPQRLKMPNSIDPSIS